MDLTEYLPMFLAEGREHLQNLNLALVRLEQESASAETTNDIFRIAHSLKGMSATMEFERMASLTHELENVLELLRASGDGLTTPALELLFACLDCLEGMTSEIESAGVKTTDPGAQHLAIGERNLEQTERALGSAGIRIRVRATGGSSGRTVEIDVASGRVFVRTAGRDTIEI